MSVFDNPDIKLEVVGVTPQGMPITRISGPVTGRRSVRFIDMPPLSSSEKDANRTFYVAHVHEPIKGDV